MVYHSNSPLGSFGYPIVGVAIVLHLNYLLKVLPMTTVSNQGFILRCNNSIVCELYTDIDDAKVIARELQDEYPQATLSLRRYDVNLDEFEWLCMEDMSREIYSFLNK